MEPPSARPDTYYDRFKTTPVTIKPFEPAARAVAGRLAAQLRPLVPGTEILVRGSTAWGIAGKGDIELGVFPVAGHWERDLQVLAGRYGPSSHLEENYARFNDVAEGYEVEIIVLRGREAEIDRKLHTFLGARPDLLAEYERIKRTFAYSRREYQRQKDLFFARVVAMLP